MNHELIIKELGTEDYTQVWQAMQSFTDTRKPEQADEIWFVEHPPVFTQGLAGKKEHILDPGDIPIVQSDRGGQVTLHAPGQLVVYFMIDLKRRGLGIRSLVSLLENTVINILDTFDIESAARADAPGVYVDGAKIASVGLKIRRGCSYHGLSFNINMDLSLFERINPCGLENLAVTSLLNLGIDMDVEGIKPLLLTQFTDSLPHYAN